MSKRAKLLQRQADAPEVTRLKTGGLRIDIRRPDFHEFHTASGANLSRLLQRIDSSVDFLLLTTFRPSDLVGDSEVPRSKTRNKQIFTQVPAKIRESLGTKRIGAYWLIGHWAEPDSSGKMTDNLEYSWLLTKDDDAVTGDDWLTVGQELANRYTQTAFIVRLDGKITLRGNDGTVFTTLSSDRAIEDAWKNLAQLRASGEPHGFTEMKRIREKGRIQPLVLRDDSAKAASAYHVRGNGQAYEPEFYVVASVGNFEGMAFKALGIKNLP